MWGFLSYREVRFCVKPVLQEHISYVISYLRKYVVVFNVRAVTSYVLLKRVRPYNSTKIFVYLYKILSIFNKLLMQSYIWMQANWCYNMAAM